MSQESVDTECVIETRNEKGCTEFHWKIPRKLIDSLKTGKRVLSSENFSSKFFASTWYLQMKNNENHFAIYLHLNSANESILFRFTLILKALSAKQDEVNRIEKFISNNRGWPNWISHEELENNEYWHDDCLKIVCKVEMKVAYEEVHHVPTNDSFQKLLDSGDYSDLVLSVGNKEFKVHRGILAARCEYFDAMFGKKFKESKQSSVEIKGIEAGVFNLILSYIYTGQITTDSMNSAEKILIAADQLLLQELVQVCERNLCDSIELNNCVSCLIFADTHSRRKLKEEVVKFINNNFKVVLETESWKQMKANHIHLAVEVLEFFHTQDEKSSPS